MIGSFYHTHTHKLASHLIIFPKFSSTLHAHSFHDLSFVKGSRTWQISVLTFGTSEKNCSANIPPTTPKDAAVIPLCHLSAPDPSNCSEIVAVRDWSSERRLGEGRTISELALGRCPGCWVGSCSWRYVSIVLVHIEELGMRIVCRWSKESAHLGP